MAEVIRFLSQKPFARQTKHRQAVFVTECVVIFFFTTHESGSSMFDEESVVFHCAVWLFLFSEKLRKKHCPGP
jgi:hypothetical protein